MNNLPDISNLVDGFISLGILLYLVFYDRKDNKDEREKTSLKDKEQQAELKEARDAHVASLRQHAEDYAGLLEKSLIALRDMAGVQKDHLSDMENRIINKLAEEFQKLKN